VVLVGSAALMVGTVRDALRRLIDGWLFLTIWMAATWGALAFSVLTEAATDYPRFATLLLAPLAVAAAAGIVGASLAAGRRLAARNTRSAPGAVLAAAIVLTVLIASPLTVGRYDRQSVTYQPRNATALTAAVTWIDGHVADDLGVLTEVRDGKWLEGLTGREALFSQPVRYAFRPTEWQRSVDADAILRSVTTLTSGYMTAMYTSAAGSSRPVPTDLMLRANHGGEYVDVLRLSPSRTEIRGAGGEATAAGLVPVRVAAQESDERVTLSTVWGLPDDDAFTFTQTVTLYIDGTTARVRQNAPGARLATELMPPAGMAMTSLAIDGDEAVACFTKLGATPPCVQITAAAGAGLSRTLDGGLRIESGAAGEIDLLVTATTAGAASVSLAHLDPAEIVDARKIGAALLYAPDPSYGGRVARLESIGFREAQTFGPYVVLVRDGASAP
jgi:hypothetical protein